MMLLTKENRKALPPLYSQEHTPDADKIVFVKLFPPAGAYSFLITEFDGKDTMFGFATGPEPEWGYFSLRELESVRGPMGLGIERDRYFEPGRFADVVKREMRTNPSKRNPAKRPKKMWMGSPPTKCDICGKPPRATFVDGQTVMGPWAIMCSTCHEKVGTGLGMGQGQMYDVQTLEKIRG
jgi:hypothetical protein